MKSFGSIRLASGIVLLAILGLVCWLYMRGREASRERLVADQSSAAPADALPAAQGGSVSSYFVYNNGDPDDFMQGQQFYGTTNKLGINKGVIDALPSSTAAFFNIANRNPQREQFLQSAGRTVDTQSNFWTIRIIEKGAVNGDTRLAVLAMLGRDAVGGRGELYMKTSHVLHEIWKLDEAGNSTLLDRSLRQQVGLNTVAEVAPPPLVPITEDVLIGDWDPVFDEFGN